MQSDPELDQIRAAVSCPLLLERYGYQLDTRESTRNNPKYRRGAGEIVIVNHGGQGWWDPGSSAKGDVFALAQHLDRSLNFGQVRRELRKLIGMAPTNQPAEPRPQTRQAPEQPPEMRWSARPRMREGSGGWRYLVERRGLPPEIVAACIGADTLREGPHGSAWFAHRDDAGKLTGIEMRGPDFRGFSAGGDKSLFRLQLGTEPPTRLAVLEAPIKAMAMAVIEGHRTDTLYVATAGGMGPKTLISLDREMDRLRDRPGTIVVAASDADAAGEKYAARIAELAQVAGLAAERLTPIGHKDWDDMLKAGDQRAPARRVDRSPALAQVLKALARPERSGPAPWTPRPLPMGERVRAFEDRASLRAAEAMAHQNTRPDAEPVPRRPSPGMGPVS